MFRIWIRIFRIGSGFFGDPKSEKSPNRIQTEGLGSETLYIQMSFIISKFEEYSYNNHCLLEVTYSATIKKGVIWEDFLEKRNVSYICSD